MIEKRATAGSGDRQKSAPAPAIPLPRGGGAIRGMGEKFSANPVNGTCSMNVPIAPSPGRSGFGPQLSLSYDSGSGNGPFGFGWTLSTAAIVRKTERGLPRYRDAEESDVFVISGAEDLVPLLHADGTRVEDTVSAPGFTIHPYRPRVEGLFARIERWTDHGTGEIHWRSISRENITTRYGTTADSRIAKPGEPRLAFAWLIADSYDAKGNAIVYEYASENDANVDRTQVNERNRVRTANRYVKRIRYGNVAPNRDANWNATDPSALAAWKFEVLFDYDEDHYAEVDDRFVLASSTGKIDWSARPDPYSSYRAGFEVRTYRRCRRILMFHRFAELGAESTLVRATELDYADLGAPAAIDDELGHQGSTRFGSFLRRITQSGFVRDDTKPLVSRNGVDYPTYLRKALPPLELEYSRPVIHDKVRELDDVSLQNLPAGIDDATYQWIDLDGEGVSGVLAEQAEAWFYKPNLGNGQFGSLQLVSTKPSIADTNGGGQRLLDLAGDGQLDVVSLRGPAPGFFERTLDGEWAPFRAFEALPTVDWDEPNLRFVDLDGDGHADILITEEDVFTWYPSLDEKGFGAPRRIHTAADEESGPRLVFADGTQSLYLADMLGDGLTALVRIRNGEVCYWPNLGYGRFGAKVTMDHAPWFDHPDQFDQRRIRLADVDGSGTDDILYVGRDGVRLYFNQSGNRWSDARSLPPFPSSDILSSARTVDLLGTGTACLVWSSPHQAFAHGPLRYIDLMGGRKPHLLVRSINNLGAETEFAYAPSTKFYLDDKRAGRPWVTRVPFPVHVVERMETRDRIRGKRYVTRYAYHHGYFDGAEREFRGFGLVEQWDTEETAPGMYDVPPVLTKTWFHTGAYFGRDRISTFHEDEYYAEPDAFLLDDTVLPEDLSADEEREACRALKHAMLRQEVYALDGTARQQHPYAVTEQNFTVRALQPRGENEYAIFFTHPRESICHHYERDPADPRITHAFTLDVDAYGNVLREVTVAYGRRTASDDPLLTPDDKARQLRALIVCTERTFTNPTLAAPHYRTPLPAEERKYELTAFTPLNAPRFTFDEWPAALAAAADIPYEQPAGGLVAEKRLVQRTRTLYRKDDLTAFLNVGDVDALATAGESYRLALTPGLAAHVYLRKEQGQPDEELLPNPAPTLEGKGSDGGGYVSMDGGWWIPSGRTFFDPAANVANPALTAALELGTARVHFYLPRKSVDAFDRSTTFDYDAHDLLVAKSTDALGNVSQTAHDYRALQPRLLTDANGNRRAAAFDALGMPVATAVMGKAGEDVGDLLEDVDPDPSLSDVQDFVAAPEAHAAGMLGKATTRIVYDLDRYRRTGQPSFAATLARETHFHDEGGDQPRIQMTFAYSDGFGRQVQEKIQAEAGEARKRAALQLLPSGDVAPGNLLPGQAHAARRWVGSGRTLFNNKSKPVKQYEPFFSATHLYEPEPEMTETGISKLLVYDPLDRIVATLHPNQTYEKGVVEAWQQTTWDVNDTVLSDPETDADVAGYVGAYLQSLPAPWETWHEQRAANQLGAAEAGAAAKAAAHANTPSVAHLDPLGRGFLTIDQIATRVDLDIEGNQRAVHDDDERLVIRYDYDLNGTRIQIGSMDGGWRWMLHDAAGNRIRAWDSRRFLRRLTYDPLRRPAELFVTDNGGERLAERTVYGEAQGAATNHRTRIHQRFDGAGIVTNVAYDFKGNVLESRRDLLPDYEQAVDWQLNPVADDGTFTTLASFDALDRPLTTTTPDGSVYRPAFNEANLLESLDVNLRGAQAATAFVKNVDYDAKGQRARIVYGNEAATTYVYDALTFRLANLKTTRPANPDATAAQLFHDPSIVQDLHYTYDPVGNVTRIEDAALKTVFHNGQQVAPVCTYTYDALDRLVEAIGREHIAQNAHDFNPPAGNHRDRPFAGHGAQPLDLQALRNYTEQYEYDAAGNFEMVRHFATGGNWTRDYDYEEESALEAGKPGNRLTRTTVGNGPNQIEAYTHDAHGNMTSMSHLPDMHWNFEDQLHEVALGGGGTAWYVYDGDGRRIRKVLESQNGTRRKERIRIGDFEIYREFDGNGNAVLHERETLQLRDDQHRFALVETLTIDAGNAINNPVPLQRYQLGNHLGSASLELDATGALITYEEYHPYGTTAFQAGRSAGEVSSKRYRYTGKERDEESGLADHGARYYAPWLGRWTAVDPILLEPKPTEPDERDGEAPDERRSEPRYPALAARELNGYVFTFCNPVVYTDPDGKAPTTVGHIYVLRTKVAGQEVVYTGQTARELAARLFKDRHKWTTIIKDPTTTIEAYKITGELDVAASGRGTLASAKKEALSAAEQVIKKRRAGEGSKALNSIEAAEEANIAKWGDRHAVRLGPRVTFRAGVKVGAFAGFVLLDLFLQWRDQKVSKYIMAPYLLEDENGVYSFGYDDGGLFGSTTYHKTYESGALKGTKVRITESQYDEMKAEAKLLWGYLDFWGDFVPGLLQPTLPIIDSCTANPDLCA